MHAIGMMKKNVHHVPYVPYFSRTNQIYEKDPKQWFLRRSQFSPLHPLAIIIFSPFSKTSQKPDKEVVNKNPIYSTT